MPWRSSARGELSADACRIETAAGPQGHPGQGSTGFPASRPTGPGHVVTCRISHQHVPSPSGWRFAAGARRGAGRRSPAQRSPRGRGRRTSSPSSRAGSARARGRSRPPRSGRSRGRWTAPTDSPGERLVPMWAVSSYRPRGMTGSRVAAWAATTSSAISPRNVAGSANFPLSPVSSSRPVARVPSRSVTTGTAIATESPSRRTRRPPLSNIDGGRSGPPIAMRRAPSSSARGDAQRSGCPRSAGRIIGRSADRSRTGRRSEPIARRPRPCIRTRTSHVPTSSGRSPGPTPRGSISTNPCRRGLPDRGLGVVEGAQGERRATGHDPLQRRRAVDERDLRPQGDELVGDVDRSDDVVGDLRVEERPVVLGPRG